MSRVININEWKGVLTNADPIDIPPEFVTELKNFYPKNGRLLKTFGYGVKLNSATAQVLDSLSTYVESHLTGSGLSGECYIGIYVAANNVATFYAWNPSAGPAAWSAMSTVFSNWTGTWYHSDDMNPVLLIDRVMRFLPGAIGEDGSGNEGKGVWLGYIDREWFDGGYTPSAAYFNYQTSLIAPTIGDFTFANVSGGQFNTSSPDSIDTYYYRLSYVYDGYQEGKLSSAVGVKYGSNEQLKITHAITKATHNRRITGIKLYRAAQENEVSVESGKPAEKIAKSRSTHGSISRRRDSGQTSRRGHSESGSVFTVENSYTLESVTRSNFRHIMTIDLTRKSGKTKAAAAGCYSSDQGAFAILNGLTYPLDGVSTYTLSINGAAAIAIDAAVTETCLVHFTAAVPPSDVWNVEWELFENGSSKQSSTTGGFYGDNILYISESVTADAYVGGILYVDATPTHPMLITRNTGYAVEALSDGTIIADSEWVLMRPADGLYFESDNPTTATYTIFDNSLTEGLPHPYEGETSIKVNGKYARYIGNRLWQANIVLNPGDDNEAQPNWVSYSELYQPDVNPVSNVITMHDVVDGGCTGLHEIMGNPVILKKNSIITFGITGAPNSPEAWGVQESAHNIGNIATHGSIDVLDNLYVCYYDGIYELSPNNLAESDRTPTNKLKISDQIGDIYEDISDKTAILSGYDPVKNEIHWYLDSSNAWAYSIETKAWRQIDSGQTIGFYANDEDNGLLMYDDSDKKVYDLNTSESVTSSVVTKTFEVSLDEAELIKYLAITYKSSTALTATVYYDDDIESGDIQGSVTYKVRELPYVDGSTYTVTYNGTGYTHEQEFTGVVGNKDYTVVGTGVVELFSEHELPSNGAKTPYFLRLARWAKRVRVEITSAAGTTDVEIDKISMQLDR